MGVLFLIDLVSIMLWVVLLKVFTQLRFFDGYLQLQKDAWLIMAVQEAYALNEYFLRLLLPAGNDLTFQFNWVTNENKSFEGIFSNQTQLVSRFSQEMDQPL